MRNVSFYSCYCVYFQDHLTAYKTHRTHRAARAPARRLASPEGVRRVRPAIASAVRRAAGGVPLARDDNLKQADEAAPGERRAGGVAV